MSDARLPDGFDALEPFVPVWAVEGSANRADLRHLRSEEERAAFYKAGKDLLLPALDYLDRKPLHELDARERRLMDLMLSLGHVLLAIEGQAEDETRHAESRVHMKIVSTPADR